MKRLDTRVDEVRTVAAPEETPERAAAMACEVPALLPETRTASQPLGQNARQ